MLDDDGLVDLAEVRWRTGDLDGAGEAAAAVGPRRRRAGPRPDHRRRGGHGPGSSDGSAQVRDRRIPTRRRSPRRPVRRACRGPPSGRPIRSRPCPARRRCSTPRRHRRRSPVTRPVAAAGVAAVAASDARGRCRPRTTPRTRRPSGRRSLLVDEPDGADTLDDAEAIYERGVQALAIGRTDDAALAFGLALRLGPALASGRHRPPARA